MGIAPGRARLRLSAFGRISWDKYLGIVNSGIDSSMTAIFAGQIVTAATRGISA